jgi:hypothetical protein
MALVKIQNASTKTDVINELEYFAERKLKEQQQQQQQQAMMQAAALAQQGDNMNQQQQLKNEGAVQAKQAEAEGRIANTLVQQGIQE